jgi:Sucrase/ferredoxin-like
MSTGSHRRRDVRCAIAAPKLEHGEFRSPRGRLRGPLIGTCRLLLSAFSETLEREGWEVHTQLDHPTGPPLEDFTDGVEKETELNRRLQELDHDPVKRALILKTSHIGGHKYAGNVIVGLSPLVRVRPVLINGTCADLHAPGRWHMVWPCINP